MPSLRCFRSSIDSVFGFYRPYDCNDSYFKRVYSHKKCTKLNSSLCSLFSNGENFKPRLGCSNDQMTAKYVGGSMTLSALVSQVINASCNEIDKDKFFSVEGVGMWVVEVFGVYALHQNVTKQRLIIIFNWQLEN